MQTLTELVREMRGDKVSTSGDFDKDVELYLQKKDDLNQTENSRTAVLQKKVHRLEEENKELRDRIAGLEGEKHQILDRLHSFSSKPSDEELAILVTKLRGELLEKERVISELQGKPLLPSPSSVKSRLMGDIRKELGRSLSPRSASLDQKMMKLRQNQGKRGASVTGEIGSPEFMAGLSKNYESMMEKYEQRAAARNAGGKELSVIKEKLGATGKQLIQIVSRPTSSHPRPALSKPSPSLRSQSSYRSLRTYK